MRPIDADALLRRGIKGSGAHITEDGILMIPLQDVLEAIESAPTVDQNATAIKYLRKMEQLVPPNWIIYKNITPGDDVVTLREFIAKFIEYLDALNG